MPQNMAFDHGQIKTIFRSPGAKYIFIWKFETITPWYVLLNMGEGISNQMVKKIPHQ